VLTRERGKPTIASAKVRAAKVRLRKANKHRVPEARPENERNGVNNFADMLLLLLKPCILSVCLVASKNAKHRSGSSITRQSPSCFWR
jgi:hypothetical protein